MRISDWSSDVCSSDLLLVEARAQHLHRLGAVLVLRLLVLALHHDTGRQVGDPHRRVGGVDVLATGALRAVGVDPQILVVDVRSEERRGGKECGRTCRSWWGASY